MPTGACIQQSAGFSCAQRDGASYQIEAPQLVPQSGSFIEELANRADASASVLVGFDFPIGVPAAFARAANIHRFRDELPQFGAGRWSEFYKLADNAHEISLRRPFYPARPGGTSRNQLVAGLGLQRFDELLRQCDRACHGRSNACSVFWTLGGNQVGRAAISGWKDVLAPALASSTIAASLWPFDGELHNLLAKSRIVIAETYPTEACRVVGIPFPGRRWSKRNRTHRSNHALKILEWCERNQLRCTEQLRRELFDGFSEHRSGEDRFDAVIGLLAMVAAVTGLTSADAPASNDVRDIEGWILGQPVEAHAG
jgi:hypothetical protein